MQGQEGRPAALFAEIPERNPSDNILGMAQQHHVALSSMADTKANIIITVSSIVLTLSLGRASDPALRVAVLILSVFTLLALLLAILAVLPKYRPLRLGGDELPRVQGGMGTAIISTSSGVMTGHEAKQKGVGGEVVAYVW